MKFADCCMVKVWLMVDVVARNSFELFPKCDMMTFMVQQKLNLPLNALLLSLTFP